MRIFKIFRKLEELRYIIKEEICWEKEADREKDAEFWEGIQKRFDSIERSLDRKFENS